MIDLPLLDFPTPAIIRPSTADLLQYNGPALGMLPGAPVIARSAAAAAAFPVYRDFATSADGQSTYTFSGLDFGPTSAGRHLIAMCCGRQSVNRTFVEGFIGGVEAEGFEFRASGGNHAWGMIAPVPTGESGSVVVTLSSHLLRCAVALYSVTGLNSATPTDTNWSASSGTGLNLTIAAGGFAVAVGYSSSSTGAWTGLTERISQTTSQWTPNGAFSSAMDAFATEQIGRAIGVVLGSERIAVSAAFR